MQYEVRLKAGFPGPRRNRAGISVVPGKGITVELDANQVEDLESDPWFVVAPAEASQDVEVKAPTKKELLADAEARGLTLVGINSRSNTTQVQEAIALAEASQDAPESTDESETDTDSSDDSNGSDAPVGDEVEA